MSGDDINIFMRIFGLSAHYKYVGGEFKYYALKSIKNYDLQNCLSRFANFQV